MIIDQISMFKVITFSDFLQHINPGHLLD